MSKYIDADKLIAEIEKRQEERQDRRDSASWKNEYWPESDFCTRDKEDDAILSIITSLQQEPRFPQYDNIVEKIFGAANIEWLEYREAEMLVALAKEELLKSLQQEQPNDLASLISEATNVAKRIVDRDSFYNSLPQNLRDKYTSEAWCEILDALSTTKGQEQPEVELDGLTIMKEIKKCGCNPNEFDIARHFYELGKARNGYEKA